MRNGWMPGDSPPKLSDWLLVFFAQRELKPSSRRDHQVTHRISLDYFGDVRIDSITRQHAAGFRAALAEREGCSEPTARKHIRNFKAVLAEAFRQNVIPYNPFDQIAGGTVRVDSKWRHVTAREIEQVIEQTDDPRWHALIGLTRYGGLRRREALAIVSADVDPATRLLTVRNRNAGGRRTTKDRERVVPISPRLFKLIGPRLNASGALVGFSDGWLTGAHKRGGMTTFKAMIRAAGLAPWSKPFHDLRKSCEADWLKSLPIADVARIMGHDPKIALEHYHQLSASTIRRIASGQASDAEREIAELRAKIAELEAAAEGKF
ncbi:MAG: site-specific integrase [Planctomycetota bacterium]